MRYVWNPEDFNPLDLLPARLHRQADAARALVHLIEYRRLDKRCGADGWVTLQAKYLRNVVGVEHCEALRDALAERGVISVVRSYTVGRKSFEYRIGPRFERSPFRRFLVTDKFLVRRMSRHLGRTLPDPHDPTEVGLFGWLKRLGIDARAARDFLPGFGAGAEWLRQKLLAIDMLAQGDVWFTRDRYRRVHTNFTNLWSELRRFLSVGGEPIVELDIANSQPLFFGLLAMAKWHTSQLNGRVQVTSKFGSAYTDSVNNQYFSVTSSPSPLTSLYDAGMHRRTDRADFPTDLAKYLTLVERGDFYEHLMEKSRRTRQTRDGFKESFFKHVFYANRSYPNAYAAVFREEFPTAYAILTDLKAVEPRDAPRKMQQLEADFVIGTCCRKLLAAHPGVPLLTLHDGLWTTPDHIGLVRNTVEAEFDKLGVRPLLRCRSADGRSLPPGASVQT
ncbi:hypothetical protein R5W24_005323 [Gemmata sp. JC717]|uniref:hypothetical protein n=1 Tax=Gemmata algarum TaxID=2975278 RepID=UPI0021BAAAF3|nr:hypothetical protein [Gemmata algarum]MDY3556160.1 hypothetical protein [Gemmata algarum]